MCLVATALSVSRDFPFVLIANRDERHDRPTEALAWWKDAPDIIGGRDKLAGGSWLAAARCGRVAAVTNVHAPRPAPAECSRGRLVATFVSDTSSPADFARQAVLQRHLYGPFNLLLYAQNELHYVSHSGEQRAIGPGIFALSNTAPENRWPKTEHAGEMLARILAADKNDPLDSLLDFLAGESIDRDSGATPDFRRDVFIRGAEYGTRCSSVLLISGDRRLRFSERRFDASGQCSGEDHFVVELTQPSS
jgi:uncharacterized protein with NRDE domain